MRFSAWRIGVLLSTLLPVTGLTQGTSGPRTTTSGEIIVKFSDSSSANKIVRDAVASDAAPETLQSGELGRYVRSVSREIRVPLEVDRVGSGDTVLLSISRTDLVAALIDQIKRDPDVDTAQRDGDAVAVVLKQGRATGIDELTAKLSQTLGLALTGEETTPGQFVVRPDVPSIAAAAVERLKKRTDIIAYAQLNALRRPNMTLRD